MKKTILLLTVVSFSLNSFVAKAQHNPKKKIAITVQDLKSKPVSGAVIFFDDVQQQKRTNAQGKYQIEITKPPKEITAFSPSNGVASVKYTEKPNITLVLKKENELFGAANPLHTNVNMMEYKHIYDYVSGKVSNVKLGDPILSRKINVTTESKAPLFVLNDKIIDQSSVRNIEVANIKNVRVLKGAETVVYGSKGANGVILVETY